MQHKHISKEERGKIENGSSNKKIAEALVRSASTIGLELKRNYGEGARSYEHERAQKLTDKPRKDSNGPKISEKTW